MSGDNRWGPAAKQRPHQTNCRRKLMGATALLVLATATQAIAQQVPAAPDQAQEIVITASRVSRSGFSAPTPTTMLNAGELQRRAPNNVSEVLNELPTFRASISPNTQSLSIT